MNCKQCGNVINPGEKYCTKCGAMVVDDNQAQAATPVTPQPVVGQDVAQPVSVASGAPSPFFNDASGSGMNVAPQTPVQPAVGGFSPTPQPQMNQPVQPVQPMQQVQTSLPAKSNKKVLFIVLGSVLAVVLLAVVGFVIYINTPAYKFSQISKDVSESGYKMKIFKDWDTSLVPPVVEATKGSDSKAMIVKSNKSYQESKDIVDKTIKKGEDSGAFKVTSSNENTDGAGTMYRKGITFKDVDGTEYSVGSYLYNDKSTGKVIWVLVQAKSSDDIKQWNDYSPYILASVDITDKGDTSLYGMSSSGSGLEQLLTESNL